MHRRYLSSLALLLVLALASACANQPQFLTPAPTQLATETPQTQPSVAPTVAESLITPTAEATRVPTETTVPPSPTVTLGDIPAMERRLYDTPVFQNFDSGTVKSIFAVGQSLGMRADVFAMVGDSNTSNGDFMRPMGMGADVYCDWGDYADLQATVAYFSVPPDDEAKNSFLRQSVAAKKGFTSAAALDPFWVSDDLCPPSENALVCEYNAVQPGTAVIMLGNIDINDLTAAQYDANMRTIVQYTAQRGVIPVLTTFVVIPERGDLYERSLEMNMKLLDMAAQLQIPLINLWAPAQSLPEHGIGPDHTHLKAVVGSFCSFNGAQNQYGGTLRNLLTLQALDLLRLGVLTTD